jgi:hypothetical protein
MATLSSVPRLSFVDSNGNPLVGGKLWTYQSGTSTPLPTYTTSAATTPNTNPIILDSRGEALVYLGSSPYRFYLTDANDVPVWAAPVDNVVGADDTLSERLVWVDDYGVNTVPGTTDMTAAINAAIAAVGNGGVVMFLDAVYKTTSPVLAENMRGITLRGQKGQIDFGGTQIVGSHTGKAVVSFVGSLFSKIESITILGDTASRPKVGLLLGRSSAASAGNHTFIDLIVSGYYSVAGVYNIASEENTFVNPYVVPSSAPLSGLYMCQADGQAGYTIGGLTSSSMECNTFLGGIIGNIDTTAGSSCIYVDSGAATGHHQFYGTFLSKRGGDSFIKIRLGAIDGLDSQFPLTFHKCIGEISLSAPTSGLHIVNTGNYILGNLSASLHFNGGTNMILCDGTGTTTLRNADISTGQITGVSFNTTLQKVQGSRLSLFNEATITIGDLAGSDVIFRNTPTITTDSGGNTLRDMTGAILSTSPYTSATVNKEITLTYSASIAVNAALGNSFRITVTNGSGFSVLSPTNPKAGQRITIRIINSSGGAMGVIAWPVTFKLATWTNPANTFSRSISFIYDGTAWQEESRTPADVPG